MTRQVLFISSVQKELAEERRAVRDFVRGDPLLRRFFDVWLFEDQPAADRRADELYLEQVGRCGLYVGIYGHEYGAEDRHGVSPTEREFDRATAKGKPRLIFVKGIDDKARHRNMTALIRKAGAQLIRRRFTGTADLNAAVYASLVEHLAHQGVIQTQPIEERVCDGATLADIDDGAVATFVRRARGERQFPLDEGMPVSDILTHLHMLVDGQVTNAAVLLFGRDPQRFLPCAEVRCMHFHGSEIQRPVPFYRVFKGNLFEQIDQAVDFVLSKVNRSVGTRAEGPQAPVRHELPEDVVAEAIINAVVHRDYTSTAAVQVSVFVDRVEVWNPGELQLPLTPESLRKPHRSILRNPRIAEVLFLAHYIEKYGTGTLMMIRESLKHALPEPSFGGQQPGEFGVTVWRDWLSEKVLDGLGLNERQRKAIEHLKIRGRIGNPEYRGLFGISKPTASRDLEELCDRQVIVRVGGTGKGTHYVLKGNGLTMGSMGSSKTMDSQWAQPAHPDVETRHKPDKAVRSRAKAPSRAQVTAQVGTKLGPSRDQVKIMRKCLADSDINAMMALSGRTSRTKFRDQVLNPLIGAGFLEMTIPDKPRSSKQKYRLTDKGRAWLAGGKS